MNFRYLFLPLLLFSIFLSQIDRIFLKRNNGFCLHFIHSSSPHQQAFELPEPTPQELDQLDTILKQRFYYLAKGCHCYAFLSEDRNYVIKFHRFPSHLRLFPWVKHPFSYQFNQGRKKIKERNIQRLHYHLENYKNSFLDLKEEAGLILVHTNRTNTLKRYVTLVDKTQAEYRVSLDDVTYILQKKADLIYPTLDQLYKDKKFDEAKTVISSIIALITHCCQKGYVDADPVLKRNYGLIGLKAIHIDIGDLIHSEGTQENYLPHLKERTENLRENLEAHYPELLSHYTQAIATSESSRGN